MGESGQDEVLFAGGGELGARMAAIDWTHTPLGPVRDWPQSLRTCVRIILTSRQPMFVWWGDEMINLYNDAYRSIVGGKHPEALGQPASIVWREIWSEVAPRAYSAMQRNEGTYDEALLLIMERNGYPEETYYTFSYSPVPNDAGGTGGILCANSDDTQRIVDARQLALLRQLASETSGARTADEVCAGAARVLTGADRDLPFSLIYLEDPARNTLSLAARAGIAADHPAALTRVDASSVSWPILEAMQRGETCIVDAPERLFGPLPRGHWSVPPRQVAVMPLTPSGDVGRRGALVVGLNPMCLLSDGYRGFVELVAGQISSSLANAEAHEQERRRAEMLAELDRAKTAFFSNVSHEFRTPLTLMLGPLEDALSTPERVLSSANLDITHRNALRLLKLVNSLLDFSRLEAGRVDASFEPVDLGALTVDLASAFRSAYERAGLALRVEVEKLPGVFYVDHDMWEKIVLNLLSNALKFTFEGEVVVTLCSVSGGAELSVRDTGVGIPEPSLARVFTRFHRVQGTRSRTHEGSGIGLALVHELVRLHAGHIGVVSTLGQGSTFTVFVPEGKAHLPADRVGASRALGSTATGALPYVQEARRWLPGDDDGEPVLATGLTAPMLPDAERSPSARILVADDNSDMREYVARLLRERFQVRTVADGEQAVREVMSDPPDLVLSDVMMPNLDGFGVLKALRADPLTRTIPFIMLSARAGDESRSEGLEAGADDYLVKPFSGRELLARVTTHLQLARLRVAAERERRRLYEVFVQAPLPVAVFIGPELRCEVASPAFCALVELDDVRGLQVDEVLRGGPSDLAQIFETVRSRGEPFRASERRISLVREGVLRDAYFNLVVQPLQGSADASGLVIVASDVTPQVLARQNIERLRAAAEGASRAKDEFLSTLSHELRTPLNAIIGWSALLRRGDMTAERTARAIETVERNALALLRLIEDMLDLSRIEQGKLVLSVGPVEMVKVVELALDAVRPAADAKGVRLQPVLDSHASIVGDPDRLQQIAWNLLSNAIKFTPREGRVQVRLRREHSYVELVVSDTGQGIDQGFLPHVFERFRQQDPSFTRRNGGLGLGLAIVRSLVEMHGGTVLAQSDGEGRGATFSVRLPMAPLRADHAVPEPLALDEASRVRFECPAELKGLSVLVVDDEAETRELLGFLLEQCEVVVSFAASVEQAWEVLTAGNFDLLISDIGMPDADGYTLIRRVRELDAGRGGRIPALALTAYARSEDRTKALRAGFSMHLAKPIEPGELLAVVASLARQQQRP